MNKNTTTEVTLEYIKRELIKASPTPKAKEFAEQIAMQIEAKGDAWISDHKLELGISGTVEGLEMLAPVADNRLYFLKQWQTALCP